jgi:DNA-binding NtrC family response regulator
MKLGMVALQAHRARLVLVVDDEPYLLGLLERALCDAGYGVQSAPNGLRALELALRSGVSPDVLVADLRMPGLNGVDLAARITARHPGTKVLLISGGDPDHTQVPWAFLKKPFSPVELLRAIERILDLPSSPGLPM